MYVRTCLCRSIEDGRRDRSVDTTSIPIAAPPLEISAPAPTPSAAPASDHVSAGGTAASSSSGVTALAATASAAAVDALIPLGSSVEAALLAGGNEAALARVKHWAPQPSEGSPYDQLVLRSPE